MTNLPPWDDPRFRSMAPIEGLDHLFKSSPFVVGHFRRGANDFRYLLDHGPYFEVVRDQVKHWLKTEIRDKVRADLDELVFDIIVHPDRSDVIEFVELVDHELFGGRALVCSVDIAEEPRPTFVAKHAHLRDLQARLERELPKASLRVHMVDAGAITGTAMRRMEGLMRTLLFPDGTDNGQDVLWSLIQLQNRVSRENRRAFPVAIDRQWAFVDLRVPHLVTYDNLCLLCRRDEELRSAERHCATAGVAQAIRNRRLRGTVVMRADRKGELVPIDTRRRSWIESGSEGSRSWWAQGQEPGFHRMLWTHHWHEVLSGPDHHNPAHQWDMKAALKLMVGTLNDEMSLALGGKGDRRPALDHLITALMALTDPPLNKQRGVSTAAIALVVSIGEMLIAEPSWDEPSWACPAVPRADKSGTWTPAEVRRFQDTWATLFDYLRQAFQQDRPAEDLAENKRAADLDLLRAVTRILAETGSTWPMRSRTIQRTINYVHARHPGAYEDFRNHYLYCLTLLLKTGVNSATQSVFLDHLLLHGVEPATTELRKHDGNFGFPASAADGAHANTQELYWDFAPLAYLENNSIFQAVMSDLGPLPDDGHSESSYYLPDFVAESFRMNGAEDERTVPDIVDKTRHAITRLTVWPPRSNVASDKESIYTEVLKDLADLCHTIGGRPTWIGLVVGLPGRPVMSLVEQSDGVWATGPDTTEDYVLVAEGSEPPNDVSAPWPCKSVTDCFQGPLAFLIDPKGPEDIDSLRAHGITARSWRLSSPLAPEHDLAVIHSCQNAMTTAAKKTAKASSSQSQSASIDGLLPNLEDGTWAVARVGLGLTSLEQNQAPANQSLGPTANPKGLEAYLVFCQSDKEANAPDPDPPTTSWHDQFDVGFWSSLRSLLAFRGRLVGLLRTEQGDAVLQPLIRAQLARSDVFGPRSYFHGGLPLTGTDDDPQSFMLHRLRLLPDPKPDQPAITDEAMAAHLYMNAYMGQLNQGLVRLRYSANTWKSPELVAQALSQFKPQYVKDGGPPNCANLARAITGLANILWKPGQVCLRAEPTRNLEERPLTEDDVKNLFPSRNPPPRGSGQETILGPHYPTDLLQAVLVNSLIEGALVHQSAPGTTNPTCWVWIDDSGVFWVRNPVGPNFSLAAIRKGLERRGVGISLAAVAETTYLLASLSQSTDTTRLRVKHDHSANDLQIGLPLHFYTTPVDDGGK